MRHLITCSTGLHLCKTEDYRGRPCLAASPEAYNLPFAECEPPPRCSYDAHISGIVPVNPESWAWPWWTELNGIHRVRFYEWSSYHRNWQKEWTENRTDEGREVQYSFGVALTWRPPNAGIPYGGEHSDTSAWYVSLSCRIAYPFWGWYTRASFKGSSMVCDPRGVYALYDSYGYIAEYGSCGFEVRHC